MKTNVKAAALVGAGVLVLGGIALLLKRRIQKRAEQKPQEEEAPAKVEAVIVFDSETRELTLSHIQRGEGCGEGKEKIGVVETLHDGNSWKSITSKRNAQLIKDSNLTAEDLRNIWSYVRETRAKSDVISQYIQDTYLKESAEKVKEIINQEEGV